MPRFHKLTLTALSLVVLCLGSATISRADSLVYTNTNGDNGTFSSGAAGTLTGGQQSTSPNGQLFRELPLGNSLLTLTINGLAANSSVTLNFNLYGIQSLDGDGPAGGNSPANPDAFRVNANGATLLNASFANFPGNTQTYNGTTNTGNNAPGTGSSAQNTLGYTFGAGFGDTTYTFSYTAMTNASGSITFTFNGLQNQAPGDESFGVDNIIVRGSPAGPTAAVPEPTTMLLLGTGLVGIAFKVRRRRKNADSLEV